MRQTPPILQMRKINNGELALNKNASQRFRFYEFFYVEQLRPFGKVVKKRTRRIHIAPPWRTVIKPSPAATGGGGNSRSRLPTIKP
jgi:hypothetical protein